MTIERMKAMVILRISDPSSNSSAYRSRGMYCRSYAAVRWDWVSFKLPRAYPRNWMNSPCVPRPNPSAMLDMTDSDESLTCSTSRRSDRNGSACVRKKIALDHSRARCQMSSSVKCLTPIVYLRNEDDGRGT